MKKVIFVLCLFAVYPLYAQAPRSGDQGYGVMIGNPTGLSGKFWLDERMAIDGAFGIAQGEADVHLSILFHDFELLKRLNIQKAGSTLKLPVFIGAGPRALFDDKTEIGLRLPIGLSAFPDKTDWEFFGEFAPVIRLTPNSGIDADFAVGARYYFWAIRPK